MYVFMYVCYVYRSKKVKISKLPKYLCIQFMRFFWKATPESRDHQGVKCKIIRAVHFEDKFDIYDCCTEGVQAALRENRLAAEKRENELLEKKRAELSGSSDPPPPIPAVSGGAGSGSCDMEVDDEESAAMAAAMAMSMGAEPRAMIAAGSTSDSGPECFNSGVPKNFTGVYELFGVVTHKGAYFTSILPFGTFEVYRRLSFFLNPGRDADHGHYIGWVRQEEGSALWWKFDDDVVTEVRTENILELKGGGDWHTAYLNFYRAIEKK